VEAAGRVLAPRVSRRSRTELRPLQTVFQNADQALNPRRTVREALRAPLRLYFDLSPEETEARLSALMEAVRLPAAHLDRLPGQLSGGERQRVGIARAFAAEPDIVLCDEVTSALDVSVQAAALALLKRLQAERGSAYVFVSHDLAVVRAVSDRVAVLYQGRIMEIGPAEAVYEPPHHPYTAVLLGAILEPDPDAAPALLAEDAAEGGPPMRGCPFQRRCPRRLGPLCDERAPPLRRPSPGHAIRCHLDLADLATPLV
jgi:peptide/nickel transport system ATP-binding protein